MSRKSKPVISTSATTSKSVRKKRTLRSPSQISINSIILDSLPAHIALVDSKGVIISVNEAWKHFATDNVFHGEQYGVGTNYITACEQADGDSAGEAQAVAMGLRAVLKGSLKSFALEYPCHTPNQERWFRVMISRTSDVEIAGAVVMHLNITDCRKAEEAIQLSHRVFKNSQDHISVIGRDYYYRQLNKAYEVSHGLTTQAIQGRSIADLFGEDTFQKVIKPNFDRALSGDVVTYESWFTFKKLGGKRFMVVTYAPLPNQKGEIDSVTVIARDMTERKLTEEAYMKSEAQCRLAMDAANVGTWFWDISCNTVTWSENVEALFGLASGTFSGTYQAYLDLIHPADLPVIKNAISDTLERDDPYEVEHRIIWQDGKIRWLAGRGDVFRDASTGKPYSMAGTVVDITERKEAQESLKKKQDYISKILHTTQALIVVLDSQWRVVDFNKACENLTGRQAKHMKGKSFIDLSVISRENLVVGQKLVAAMKSGKFPMSFENAWLDHDRKARWISWSSSVMRKDNDEVEYVIVTGIDITKRRKAEQTIDQLWRQNELILHSAGEGIYGIDNSGKVTFFNQAAENMTGWTLKELLGQVVHPVLHHTKPDGTLYSWEECPIYFSLEKGETHQISTDIFWRKNDTHFPAEYTSTPIRGENGNIEGAVVTFNDISELKQAEDALRESEQRLRAIFDQQHQLAGIINTDGILIEANQKSLEFSGVQAADVIGRPFWDAAWWNHSSDLQQRLREAVAKAASGQFVRMEVTHPRIDGMMATMDFSLRPITDDQGLVVFLVPESQDITEKKKAEEALRVSDDRFQAFMNHSPVVAFLKDEKGRYVYVNQQFEEKLHFSKAECLGKTDQQLFPPHVARIFKEHDRQALKTEEVLETEETTLDEEGKVRYWWVMKFPVRYIDGQLLLGGVALDITSRKQVEEALQKREEELQALGGKLISAQEDERRRISRELHDDMNQRLAVLALNIQTAQRDFLSADPVYQTLQSLYKQVSSLSDNVRHLAYQLHPSILDDLGLEVALQSYVKDFSKWEGIPITFRSEGVPLNLSQEVASCFYRVTQESLRNIVRHAKASHVEVELCGGKGKGSLSLCIKDDGKGFDVEAVRAGSHGLGFISMQERARVVQGICGAIVQPWAGDGRCVCLCRLKNEEGAEDAQYRWISYYQCRE